MKDILSVTACLCILLHVASCTPGSTPAQDRPEGKHIFIVGGHDSHDFDRWFKDEDINTLENAGFTASYTDQPDEIQASLATADILSLTNNQPIPDPQTRQAIFDHADSGKGLLLIHAGLWYNWKDWPEYNTDLAGGGSKSHGPYGPFEVQITNPDHPVVKGLPSTFILEDELYRFEADSEIIQLDTLAVGIEPIREQNTPSSGL